MTTKHAYTVCGHYPFPFDMMRYDGAKPLSSKDQSLIASLAAASDHDGRVKEIHLICEGKPHVDRWNSFGWSVTSVRKVVKQIPPGPVADLLRNELARRAALASSLKDTDTDTLRAA